jgi:hypothetical protein
MPGHEDALAGLADRLQELEVPDLDLDHDLGDGVHAVQPQHDTAAEEPAELHAPSFALKVQQCPLFYTCAMGHAAQCSTTGTSTTALRLN